MVHIPFLEVQIKRENNQLYYTAICNNVFTTLISFYTFKIKVFSKLNILDLSLSQFYLFTKKISLFMRHLFTWYFLQVELYSIVSETKKFHPKKFGSVGVPGDPKRKAVTTHATHSITELNRTNCHSGISSRRNPRPVASS